MTTPDALQIRLGLAKKHAAAALVIAFELDDKPREDLCLSAVESLEGAMDPGKQEITNLMEELPNA